MLIKLNPILPEQLHIVYISIVDYFNHEKIDEVKG